MNLQVPQARPPVDGLVASDPSAVGAFATAAVPNMKSTVAATRPPASMVRRTRIRRRGVTR